MSSLVHGGQEGGQKTAFLKGDAGLRVEHFGP